MRLTVLGCSTAAPHPASPTAGFLVEWDTTAVLLDVGQGVIRNLQRVLEPHDLDAIVIGHMHADHYLDIVGLRYLYPWGERAPDPLRDPPAAGWRAPGSMPWPTPSRSASRSSTPPSTRSSTTRTRRWPSATFGSDSFAAAITSRPGA